MRQLWAHRSRLRLFVGVAVICVITLAVSSRIYSAVSGRHVIGHTSASPVATGAGTSAKADCSGAAAHEVVERLHLGEASLGYPVADPPLCGAFTGPGSQIMVVELPFARIDTLMFRWAEGAWFLMRQDPITLSGCEISAAASDIRETCESDSRATRVTKTRIWHWDGGHFTAGAWKQQVEPKAPVFDSPSGNINCWMDSTPSNGVMGCLSRKSRGSVSMDAQGRLKICQGRRRCLAPCGCDPPDFPRLGYGKQITFGRFRCRSQRVGVTCTVIRSGKGFLINSTSVRRVGP